MLFLLNDRSDIVHEYPDYLMSGLYHIPSGQLNALYTTRMSATTQGSLACILMPQSSSVPRATTSVSLNSSDVMLLSVQHDTGRWGSECLWHSERGASMLGVRVLRNFGKLGSPEGSDDQTMSAVKEREKRVDEEEAMEGGLKGRLSAGAELYVSTDKSAGGMYCLNQELMA